MGRRKRKTAGKYFTPGEKRIYGLGYMNGQSEQLVILKDFVNRQTRVKGYMASLKKLEEAEEGLVEKILSIGDM